MNDHLNTFNIFNIKDPPKLNSSSLLLNLILFA